MAAIGAAAHALAAAANSALCCVRHSCCLQDFRLQSFQIWSPGWQQNPGARHERTSHPSMMNCWQLMDL
jgi:hypothetical protein